MQLSKKFNYCYQNKNDMIQNLKDAGCNQQLIECFMNQLNEGRLSESICLLNKHRCCLLHSLHQEQKRIDCLDYLIYMLQRQLSD